MFGAKKLALVIAVFTLIAWSFRPQPLYALKNQYYDFGPYYNQPQILGFSFSSLENLPVPKIPDNLVPPKSSGLLPGSPFYPLERVTENIQIAFTFDPVKREELRLGFASERMSEAKTLMEEGKTEAASLAFDDYRDIFQEVTQNLSGLTEKNNPGFQVLADKVEEVAAAQVVVAQTLSLSSPPVQAEGWNSVSQTAQRVLDEIAEVRGEPPLPADLSGSIQKLKEQGLISEEESNKLYSLDSRSGVREELDKLASSGQFPASELIKLDTAVAKSYPDVHQTMTANLQVAEIKVYQTLPQPSDKILEEIEKWQTNPLTPPPNDIKPYLWYNRAQDLAKEVDLSNFAPDQQSQLTKLYPQAVVSNPTYIPPPSPSPTSSAANQSASATPSVATSVPPKADSYLGETGGALPGQTTYFIKQLGENLQFTFTFDPADKARLKMQQAERRLAEAQALSLDSKAASFYEGAIKSYQQAMEEASSYLKNSQDNQKAQEVAGKLESQAARHEIVLEKGLLPVPVDGQLITEAIQATENALDRSADIQGRPALPPALFDRLGDLKAQGLILPEEAEELVRSNSREEARKKIRKLVEIGTFPPADSKKLDEAQVLTSPSDYNQLVEVRKVEELQNLRSVQSEFARTPALKATITALGQRETALFSSIDTSFIKPEDLGGREDLAKTYQKLVASPRPINGGQFGPEVKPDATPSAATSPRAQDAVLSACPAGAIFKQFEGCVWADTGRKLNDYDQYRCEGPRQYYSFAARQCVAYEPGKGFQDDAQPICPVGYTWAWETQSCQAFTGGGPLPLPIPKPEPEPKDDKEFEERSKSCPEGSSYKIPNGCVWDKDGKPIYDSSQYRCTRGQYYSFEEQKCIRSPKVGEPYPKDTTPACKESGDYWSWSESKCIPAVEPFNQDQSGASKVTTFEFRPTFATPGSPLYPLKQLGETIRFATAFTPEARQEVRISQARERLAEGYAALEKGQKENFAQALASYTAKMQEMFNDLSEGSLSEDAKKAISQRLVKEAVEQNLILQKIEVVATNESAAAISAASSSIILGVDKAADLASEPPIPDEVKAKIEALPEQMISEEDKKKMLQASSRVEARLKLGELVAKGGLTPTDTSFLNEDFSQVDQGTQWKVEELKKLEEMATISDQKEKIEKTVEKNEGIVEKLADFQKNFEPGKEVPAEIRPYVRFTRIEEITQTIRPDIVRLEDFQNRKDIVLAVAALQEEFKPTKEAIQKIEEFRKKNPNAALPLELARIEALSFNLGVRWEAGPCYLPTPLFPANTPCPPPGAAIPVASLTSSGPVYGGSSQSGWYGASGGYGFQGASVDKDGKPLVYGQGPASKSAGVCPSEFHWMYDSGGWCMSNSGNYSSSYSFSSYTPSGPATPGYTPYTPYYTAPGAPPATSGYPVGDNSPNDGCPYGYDSDGGRGNCIPNSYPSSSYSYSPPNYYGVAPTYYTTTPPAGTVPGSGPKPTAPGQCPSGFHWMSDSGGWCMADGNTYVPSGTATSSTPPPGGYNYYSPNLTQSSCGPGYYWDGRGCIPTYSGSSSSYSGSYYSGWSGSTCTPPSSGCGSDSYWDYGTCSCRSSSSYYGGSGPSSTNYCQGISCSGGSYLDYSTCSCKYSSSSSTTSTGSSSCSPPAGGCGSGWFDSGSCSCKTASSDGCYNVSASSCGSGWYFDSAACTCRQSTTSEGTTSSGGSTTSSGSSSGSCPSGYHWMSDSGGWCMADGGSSSTTTCSLNFNNYYIFVK